MKRLLIVIDDWEALELYEERLGAYFSLSSTFFGSDGIRMARESRPDRILLGEARGGEALDMLQAMGTGVEGSMTTVHANSPGDALSRLETLVRLMTGG